MSEQIAAYLERRGLSSVETDGVYVVPYGMPDEPPELIVMIWSGERAVDGVMVEMHAQPGVEDVEVATVLERCNEWNTASRTTKARLDVDANRVVLEAWMPWTPDLPDEVLERVLDHAITDMVLGWPTAGADLLVGTDASDHPGNPAP